MFDVLFRATAVRNYRDTQDVNTNQAAVWNKVLRAEGVFKSPGKVYPCLALNEDDFALIERASVAAAQAVAQM